MCSSDLHDHYGLCAPLKRICGASTGREATLCSCTCSYSPVIVFPPGLTVENPTMHDPTRLGRSLDGYWSNSICLMNTENTEGTEKSERKDRYSPITAMDGDAIFTVLGNFSVLNIPSSSIHSFLCVLCVLCAPALGVDGGDD